MARHSVDIVVKARDDASRKFGMINKSALNMGQTLKKVAGIAAAYFGARAIKNFLAGSVELYARQEKAVKGLTDALGLLGQASSANIKDMEEFAASIQKVTVYGDEQILELMAMGSAMGKLSGQQLKDATKAAIGLSKAYSIELTGAMRLVARAAVGDVSSLTRYGIKLEEGLSKQEKFNQVMRIGAKNFKLAEGEAETFSGQLSQMSAHLGDLREKIAEAMIPALRGLVEWVKTFDIETVKSTLNFIKWAGAISAAIYLAPKIVAAVLGIAKALKALATGQAILQALSGPAGWATLAVGATIAIGAVALIDKAFGDLNSTLKDTQKELDETNKKLKSTGEYVQAGLYKGGEFSGTKIPWLEKSKQREKALRERKGKEHMEELAARTEAAMDMAERIEKLRESIKKFGKSEADLILEGMKEMGYSQQGFEMVETYKRRLKYLEKQKTLTEALTETTRGLRREIALFGKDALTAKLYDLEALGATREQLDPIKALIEKFRTLETQKMKSTLQLSLQPSLQPREARFLTFAPGTKFDSGRKTAQNTSKIISVIEKLLRASEKFYQRYERLTSKAESDSGLLTSSFA